MEVLQKLGLALGFATLAGLNLYLTVFATSLALYNGWIVLTPEYASLQILGQPAVLIVSGVMFCLEFFADKVPLVDSLWDLVHTAVRPLGGAFLALKTLGHTDPGFEVVTALLAGGVTLTVHGAKAGTRLVANGSPEPFSNVALSVTEDVAVVGGLGLLDYSYHHNPWLALVVFGSVLLTLLYVTPKIFRFTRIKLFLLWKKFVSPALPKDILPGRTLPAEPDLLFHRLNPHGDTIEWAVPCLTGRSRGGLPANYAGWLVAAEETPGKLSFVGTRGWRSVTKTLDLAGGKVSHEPRFLSNDLVIYQPERRTRQTFVFDQSRAALVGRLAESLRERTGGREAALPARPVPGPGVRALEPVVRAAESPEFSGNVLAPVAGRGR